MEECWHNGQLTCGGNEGGGVYNPSNGEPVSLPPCNCPDPGPDSIDDDLATVVIIGGTLAMADSPALPFGDIAGGTVILVGGTYVVGKYWGDDVTEAVGSIDVPCLNPFGCGAGSNNMIAKDNNGNPLPEGGYETEGGHRL
jgi:hypothetical protein